ncbi:uncharacterized protein EDB91DRAFT_561667 [Suillus paluster]|uniref:uncharacterized protein n=1 Tax=Suillus paluster TaxID=48578 RepID=UPI001B861F21|nr:uncharacterized protein EDB91DRAFT_561667 [Suillus paluster]KAG1735289.1 hypothetical protein EDB91DRAFT_561667 [Suillus paluster]
MSGRGVLRFLVLLVVYIVIQVNGPRKNEAEAEELPSTSEESSATTARSPIAGGCPCFGFLCFLWSMLSFR